MTEFNDLVAVVTGGASGIGAATAALLSERGARVAILDRDPTSVDTAVFTAVKCDITSSADVDAAIGEVARRLGGIDILVNNAGIGAAGDIAQNSDEEWHRVFDVNVVGIARVTRAALEHLRRSEHAAIVNTCSVVASVGLPQRAVYGASKGAVLALTLAMAADHLHEGIRVNAVTPGTADTPWVGRLLAQAPDAAVAAENLRARQPMGRLVTAAEVANAIAYLASPLTASTTGTILAVDGGMTGVRI
ncbi:SDR family NAD(P)-dependent oxidoreductase [Nakamurella sp. PAMC28650]|jgi:2-keto-3-deoxy-L-fuconate dehydrogenase|uniref:SDR family NAD(P)-dependent oxidoreductase n=1 Tax=Nakamurella sp. PAMC28650 TaxID=2762325 RepID=UPI00164E2FDE|nr:SDR family oxidoreductase [Nakamurella sp. PAMC28650]QNK80615.1 SDR family oxidoreductase [Nakamurella sp. PAMC28650]